MNETGIKTMAYAAAAAGSDLGRFEFYRREPGPHDVLIKIKFCGICHSDVHQVKDEWGGAIFPMVPGHEIAGIVERVGDQVRNFKPGDRVGVGCMVDSCKNCQPCNDGLEQYCEKGNIQTYNSLSLDGKTPNLGGYSEQITVLERFVVRIPDNIPLDKAAPLLCAGITTYSPLKHWNAGPGKRVGVVGLGGLGHVAVKIAHAMGAEVTVISRSLNKKKDAEAMGAIDYVATSDQAAVEKAVNSLDLIINTVSSAADMNSYLNMLKLDGVMVLVGAPADLLPVHPFSLIPKRRSLAGSTIGGMPETQEMLNFCGQHNLAADIEVIPIEKVNEAYERLLKSDVRYRFVIDIESLAGEKS
ncbi:NAD(P)-dependent alcohol dehydrogenase [soil metagenome]